MSGAIKFKAWEKVVYFLLGVLLAHTLIMRFVRVHDAGVMTIHCYLCCHYHRHEHRA